MFYRNNSRRFSWPALLLTLALFGNLSVASAQQATFTTGDVYSSTASGIVTAVGGIGVVPSSGGAVSNTFSLTTRAVQIAWSPDLTTAYATTSRNRVLKLTPDGTATTFATLPFFSAFGLSTHPDGRVLVAPLDGNEVYDISAGGTGPFPLHATIPVFDMEDSDQNYAMLRTSAGRLLLSGSYPKIYDITDPADITVDADTSGLPGSPSFFFDMAEGPSGEIYAWSGNDKVVVKVVGGVPSIFATLPFLSSSGSVAYGYGKLLLGGNLSFGSTRFIYDISAGGNFPAPPAPFATHGGGTFGQLLLETVPALYPPSPESQLAALIFINQMKQ